MELSYISKKNQNYIAVAIDSQQSSPSQAQAKRMRELDEKKLLNGDVIDPLEPCGTEKGWKLSDPGGVGYTQAWYNTGNGGYQLLNIDGVNAVASRND